MGALFQIPIHHQVETGIMPVLNRIWFYSAAAARPPGDQSTGGLG